MATIESLPIRDEDLIDTTWVLGSGYGVSVAEIPTRPNVYWAGRVESLRKDIRASL